MTINLLIFIHGITPEIEPAPHRPLYEKFWAALRREQPPLTGSISELAFVEWGNRIRPGEPRPDERLSDAERRIHRLVQYDSVQRLPGPNNQVLGALGDWNLLPGVRPVIRTVREQLVQFGLADAIYYASEDGERAVRLAVYGQVLAQLRAFREESDVRLHVVAHSLGVTVSHDFLFGMFGKATRPDFLAQAESDLDRADYAHWRERAQRGQLGLGSFVSMASQLPLFVLRKQLLVDRLAAGGVLDPADIGIPNDGEVHWLVFYDVDDALGFATRELYGSGPTIRQLQVDAGDSPVHAHTAFWDNAEVIAETAALIARQSGGRT